MRIKKIKPVPVPRRGRRPDSTPANPKPVVPSVLADDGTQYTDQDVQEAARILQYEYAQRDRTAGLSDKPSMEFLALARFVLQHNVPPQSYVEYVFSIVMATSRDFQSIRYPTVVELASKTCLDQFYRKAKATGSIYNTSMRNLIKSLQHAPLQPPPNTPWDTVSAKAILFETERSSGPGELLAHLFALVYAKANPDMPMYKKIADGTESAALYRYWYDQYAIRRYLPPLEEMVPADFAQRAAVAYQRSRYRAV